eukprot:TRINITY_DN1386_c0_g2_i6.p1 TRINITY_DN1386_c0_g2~~TRINITY_DN1386_c0_g2_i6.p1  ORF type:complete len:469 (+),score=93.34 TRINITY_DN1386_c0_g2_i6:529-1935(+)
MTAREKILMVMTKAQQARLKQEHEESEKREGCDEGDSESGKPIFRWDQLDDSSCDDRYNIDCSSTTINCNSVPHQVPHRTTREVVSLWAQTLTPSQTQSSQTQSSQTQPSQTQPQPSQTPPPQTQTQLSQIQPSQTQPFQTQTQQSQRPAQIQPSQTQTQPSQPRTFHLKLSQTSGPYSRPTLLKTQTQSQTQNFTQMEKRSCSETDTQSPLQSWTQIHTHTERQSQTQTQNQSQMLLFTAPQPGTHPQPQSKLILQREQGPTSSPLQTERRGQLPPLPTPTPTPTPTPISVMPSPRPMPTPVLCVDTTASYLFAFSSGTNFCPNIVLYIGISKCIASSRLSFFNNATWTRCSHLSTCSFSGPKTYFAFSLYSNLITSSEVFPNLHTNINLSPFNHFTITSPFKLCTWNELYTHSDLFTQQNTWVDLHICSGVISQTDNPFISNPKCITCCQITILTIQIPGNNQYKS